MWVCTRHMHLEKGWKCVFSSDSIDPFLCIVWRRVSGRVTTNWRCEICWQMFDKSFPHTSRNFQPKVISGRVTKSGHVTQPKKYVRLRRLHSFRGINMNLSGVDWSISTYETYISDFYFCEMRLSQFCDIAIRGYGYLAMGKCPNVSYSECTDGIMLIISRLSYVRPLAMIHM